MTGDGAPPGVVACGSSSETVGNVEEETVQLWAGLDNSEKLVRWWSTVSTMAWRRVQWQERERSSEWDEEEEKWGWGSPAVPTRGIRWRRMWVGSVWWSGGTERRREALAWLVLKPTDTVDLGRAQFSCTILFPIK
jgi:hypothetical protein